MDKRYLFTPGPTPLPPQVQEALSRPIIHHRTTQYRALFKRVLEGLKQVFQTTQPVLVLTSSGTGAMEAAVANLLSPGDQALVVLGGKFAERWEELCRAYGVTVATVEVAYGDAVDLPRVRAALKAQPGTKAVFATLCETSTGVVHDIQGLAAIVNGTPAVLVVDAISGLGADECQTEAWGVDIVVSGSQKALMLPPGLAFLSLSEKARHLIEQSKSPRYYFDLRRSLKALEDDDTPFTSSVSLVVALDEALKLILERGVAGVIQRCQTMSQATRQACQAMKLELFAKRPSNALTAIVSPPSVDCKKLIKLLQDRHQVTVAGGQGSMAGKLFRIAHMGYIAPSDLLVALGALELSLAELGYPVTLGQGLGAAQTVFGSVKPASTGAAPAPAHSVRA